jgi:plasmid stability protein
MCGVTKTIQIRDVPDDIHAELRARAARAGRSLSDYVRLELERVARRPSIADVLLRAQSRSGGDVSVEDIVEAVRSGRDEREAQLTAAATSRRERDERASA